MIAVRIRIHCDKFHNKSEIVPDCYNLFKSINSANLALPTFFAVVLFI